jgi:hypothetical protein
MPRFPIFCVLPALLLTGCASPRTEFIVPYVQEDLRRPCPGPKMAGLKNEGELSDAILNQTQALRCANGKIETIDKILDDAESK